MMATNWFRILALLPCALALSTALEKRWDVFQTKHAWEDVPKGWELYDLDSGSGHGDCALAEAYEEREDRARRHKPWIK